MKLSKQDKKMIENNEATVLKYVKSYKDMTLGHITMICDCLIALEIDETIVQKAIIKKMKEKS